MVERKRVSWAKGHYDYNRSPMRDGHCEIGNHEVTGDKQKPVFVVTGSGINPNHCCGQEQAYCCTECLLKYDKEKLSVE